MARRDDAHIWPDHHIVGDVEAADIIESAVLIDEDVAPDADFVASCRIDGGISRKLASTSWPMSWLNKALTSSASSNVRRLSRAVIAIARLTFASMAADSGVPR
ncbi:hypothetical protein [Mesorhizobium sp. B2-3-12]|uniref:hypothetical protein n=1 Tax=Mesorhizobium sp. B2-3-12 TaxID=2589952 RepID=UPI001FEDF731|nr:hypothetical protein [Mesorhizobium sp. B2-3-12]